MANSIGEATVPTHKMEGGISNEMRVADVSLLYSAQAREGRKRQYRYCVDNASSPPRPIQNPCPCRAVSLLGDFCQRTVGVKSTTARRLSSWPAGVSQALRQEVQLADAPPPGLHIAHTHSRSHYMYFRYRFGTVQHRHEGLSSNRHAESRFRMRRASG